LESLSQTLLLLLLVSEDAILCWSCEVYFDSMRLSSYLLLFAPSISATWGYLPT
jgi:hypothetical protein